MKENALNESNFLDKFRENKLKQNLVKSSPTHAETESIDLKNFKS